MKQVISLFFTVLSLISFDTVFGQNLTLQSTNPIPGEKVMVTYNPVGTPIEKVENFEAVCYEISEDGLKATEIYLQQKDYAYSGSFIVSKNTKAVFIALTGGEKKDNNNGEGYGFVVYEKDRKTPQAGAFNGLSSAYVKYYRNIGIDRDFDKALVYLQKEYSMNPDLKKEGKYLANYSYYGAKAKNEAVIEECRALIKTLRMHVKEEKDIQLISSIHSNIGDKEAAEEMNAKILKEYPNGELAQKNMITSLYRAISLDDKLEIYNTLKEKYSDSEPVKSSMDRIAGTLALEYGKLNDWKKFDEYLSLIENPSSKASYLNSIAWDLSGERLDAKPEFAAKGKELSQKSLELIKSEMTSGRSKPDSRTKNQWKKQLEYSYGMYADTYALCAYHDGDFEGALEFQKIACEANNFADGEMTERYCTYLSKVKGTEVVEKELQKLISLGLATANVKEQYKQVYLANNSVESALEKNMTFLESLAEEKKKKELKEKMMNEKAPDFALVNLKGEKVTLSQLRGKVVVLDFWATWCGPCKASFPGMQNAVNKYEGNGDVVFLFLDTWERVENKEENAQKFIAEKGYTFNVLLDNENEIVAKYKVGGIPTKFIIDKRGNIRFTSKGFSGNNDELVSELSMMIEMASEASSEQKTMP